MDYLIYLGFLLGGTILGALAMYFARPTAAPDAQKHEGADALKKLRDKLLEYYQKLPESPHKAHERELVGKLYHLVAAETMRVHSHPNPMAGFAANFEALVKGRLEGTA